LLPFGQAKGKTENHGERRGQGKNRPKKTQFFTTKKDIPTSLYWLKIVILR
jgi:hypothetical protein